MTKDEALKMALEALGNTWTEPKSEQYKIEKKAITAIKEALAQPAPFKPDYDTEAVLVEEMQRMAKRIEDLEMLLTIRAEQIVGLQDEIRNLTGEE